MNPKITCRLKKNYWKIIISKWIVLMLDLAVQVNTELDDLRCLFWPKHLHNSKKVSTLLFLVDCSNSDQLCYNVLRSYWGQCKKDLYHLVFYFYQTNFSKYRKIVIVTSAFWVLPFLYYFRVFFILQIFLFLLFGPISHWLFFCFLFLSEIL